MGKSYMFVFALSLISLPALAQSSDLANQIENLENVENLQVERVPVAQKTTLQKIVCVKSGSNLTVKTDSLRENRFQVPSGTPVKVFQGWGENRKSIRLGGKQIHFIKVQFPTLSGAKSYGWVSEAFVMSREECAGEHLAPEQKPEPVVRPAPVNRPAPVQSSEPEEEQESVRKDSARKDASLGLNLGTDISGLNDSKCCVFPLKNRPTTAYTSGMRRFGAGRSGGRRLHAACDLYRHINEPIYAVADGKVISGPYRFYQGTYAIEVKHEGGFIVRYGENLAKMPKGVGAGRAVSAGQHIAYMGKVNSGCCEPMLHFELYSGSAKGSLNSGGNSYQRRRDLLNPTKYLLQWEAKSL